jgi:hypothetical protein
MLRKMKKRKKKKRRTKAMSSEILQVPPGASSKDCLMESCQETSLK